MVALTFSDVLIVPKYSEVTSRKDVEISSDFNLFKLELPVFSANMKTICESKMAIELYKNGAMGILHRFCTIEEAVNEFQDTVSGIGKTNNGYLCGVSIGIQEDDKIRFDKLYEVGARIFCIDIAFGHSLNMKNMIRWIRSLNYKDIYIIAGNVATGDGAYDLCEWGSNAIRVGIGGGHACSTRKNTGVGVPQLHAIKNVREEFIRQGIKDVKIISDGAIEFVGDICKAMRYSDAVQLGRFLAGTSETPGPVFQNTKGEFYKVYAGSASGESKFSNGQTTDFIEGVAMEIAFRGKVKYLLKSIKDGLRSCYSYCGAFNTKEFQEKCEFVEIGGGGKTESKL
jgi:IMP dehydrogenase/GMP reductase